MGIFTKVDFEEAEKRGSLVVKNRGPIGSMSIDLKVQKLFRQSRILIPPFDDQEYILNASTDRFLESLIEVPLEGDKEDRYWLLKPDELYFFLAEEEVYKRSENLLSAKIVTRSSWARCGIMTGDTDELLTYADREFDDKIVGNLKTKSTYVKLRPGDAPCQLVAGYFSAPIPMEEMVKLLVHGQFKITRDGKGAMDFDLKYTKGKGLALTLDRKIKMYRGGTIDPKDPEDNHFEEVELDDNGMYGDLGDFFISSSAEEVSICSCYAGWVWHNKFMQSLRGDTYMEAHPNAPLIHPKNIFKGKITLENSPWINGYHIKPGMVIANIDLHRLESPLWKGKESRYKGQDEATLSREDC